jgi:2-dehydro-3-deoxyphosphogluconate aldolase/(4S)-4-hydroxy-2-oxoglutarate aldolase
MDMKDSLNRFRSTGVVPVVVLDDAKDAIPTARALLAGGVDVMEITFRTAAAADSIKAVSENCPEMLVGAGTVVTLDQCKQALECGAKFIVSPGFDPEVVAWCVERNVPITPGCVTPTEIMAAMKLGLNVVKFFPAGVYGGLKAMKALSAPFGGVKFIPTGGVDAKNLKEYLEAPFVHAVGGSWLCQKKEIAAGNFDAVTALCREASQIVKEVRG